VKAKIELRYLQIDRKEWEHKKHIKVVANVVKLLPNGNNEKLILKQQNWDLFATKSRLSLIYFNIFKIVMERRASFISSEGFIFTSIRTSLKQFNGKVTNIRCLILF